MYQALQKRCNLVMISCESTLDDLSKVKDPHEIIPKSFKFDEKGGGFNNNPTIAVAEDIDPVGIPTLNRSHFDSHAPHQRECRTSVAVARLSSLQINCCKASRPGRI